MTFTSTLRSGLFATFGLCFSLVGCGGDGDVPGGGTAGSGTDGGTGGTGGTSGSTDPTDCGPSFLDCLGCNGFFAPAACVDGHWECKPLSCPGDCGPQTVACDDCDGQPVQPMCVAQQWVCPSSCVPESPSAKWSVSADGQGSQAGKAIAAAPDGSIYVGGSFGGTLDLGGKTYTTLEPEEIFVHDALIARLAPDGSLLWARQLGSIGRETIEDVAVDGAGNAVFVGTYKEAQEIDGFPLPGGLVGGLFVVKLDPEGNVIFAKGLTGGANGTRGRVEVTPAGDILIAGDTSGTIDLGDGPVTGGNAQEPFVVRLDPLGNHVYSRRWGGTAPAFATDLALAPNGEVVVVGTFRETIDFGKGPLVSHGEFDVFLLRLDAGGAVLSSQRFGGPGDDRSGSVVTDSGGAATISTTINDGADFGEGPIATVAPRGLLASYEANGTVRRLQLYGELETQTSGLDVFRLAVDAYDRVIVAGQFVDVFFPSALSLDSAGRTDLILATVEGVDWRSTRYGSANDEIVDGVAVDPTTGDVLVAGSFWGALDLGAGPLKTKGDGNLFWARFPAAPPPNP